MLWTVAVRRRPIFLPGWNLHTAQEIGIDDFQAKRSPDNRYRTEPLRALFDKQKIHKGGFYHFILSDTRISLGVIAF
jgi:hypothetical protein